ncbi:MAG: hypothetical protein JSS79_03115 [Bacteroidetes bacterium]|nr:hypothetical protein [Bacteroidota bacterium]
MELKDLLGVSKAAVFVLFVCFSWKGHGQVANDSMVVAKAKEATKEIYVQAMGAELGLYNGVFYKEFPEYPSDDGQPYYASAEWYNGTVFYDGIRYDNIPMHYDLVNDKLIIDHQFAAVKLELISRKVSYFDFEGHHFVWLDNAAGGLMQAGFYEQHYDGKIKCYTRWYKKRIESIGAREVLVRYEEHRRMFIIKDNMPFTIKGKASLLKVLKDKKPLLQKYIRKANLDFYTHKAEAVANVLDYYESGNTL